MGGLHGFYTSQHGSPFDEDSGSFPVGIPFRLCIILADKQQDGVARPDAGHCMQPVIVPPPGQQPPSCQARAMVMAYMPLINHEDLIQVAQTAIARV